MDWFTLYIKEKGEDYVVIGVEVSDQLDPSHDLMNYSHALVITPDDGLTYDKGYTYGIPSSYRVEGLEQGKKYTAVLWYNYEPNSNELTFRGGGMSRNLYVEKDLQATEVRRLYASVDGKAKSIAKVYASKNGEAVQVWPKYSPTPPHDASGFYT